MVVLKLNRSLYSTVPSVGVDVWGSGIVEIPRLSFYSSCLRCITKFDS